MWQLKVVVQILFEQKYGYLYVEMEKDLNCSLMPVSTLTDSQTLKGVPSKSARIQGCPTIESLSA